MRCCAAFLSLEPRTSRTTRSRPSAARRIFTTKDTEGTKGAGLYAAGGSEGRAKRVDKADHGLFAFARPLCVLRALCGHNPWFPRAECGAGPNRATAQTPHPRLRPTFPLKGEGTRL